MRIPHEERQKSVEFFQEGVLQGTLANAAKQRSLTCNLRLLWAFAVFRVLRLLEKPAQLARLPSAGIAQNWPEPRKIPYPFFRPTSSGKSAVLLRGGRVRKSVPPNFQAGRLRSLRGVVAWALGLGLGRGEQRALGLRNACRVGPLMMCACVFGSRPSGSDRERPAQRWQSQQRVPQSTP